MIYLVTDEARFLKKKNGITNLDQRGQNRAWNYVFCHFLKFCSLVFPEIPYSDSLQQSLTSRRVNAYKKNLGPNIQKLCPRLGFLAFPQVLLFDFPLSCIDDSLEQCQTTSRDKTRKKKLFENQIWVKRAKIGTKIRFFAIFSSSLVFLKIAYDDCLEQCLTTNRGKTQKENWGPHLGINDPKSGLELDFFWHFLKFGSLVFLEICIE